MLDNLPNPHEDDILSVDTELMIKEFNEGKEVGEESRISELKDQFTWKRGMVNCWTGAPNTGKTEFTNFLSVTKSNIDNWKWCIFTPEMVNAHKHGDKVIRSASDVYDQLIHTYTGKSPYKHWKDQYNIPQMSLSEYVEAMDWVEKHFYVIEPKDKSYKNLIDTFMYYYETMGFDGFMIDPWKNVLLNDGRTDEVLHAAFDVIRELTLDTNTTGNIIAHPKSMKEPKNPDGSLKLITQFDLLGGSAWNNSMDGIFSNHRPYTHKNPNDPEMWLYHLKQRKKHLVGKTGVYKLIKFNWKTNRYYFDGICPIDGTVNPALTKEEQKEKAKISQSTLEFKEENAWLNEPKEDAPY